MVISNAFGMSQTRLVSETVESDDIHKFTFSTCNPFNRRLHARHYRHRRGGRAKPGDFGVQEGFPKACILQSPFTYSVEPTLTLLAERSFRENCEILALELGRYGGTIE
jgi:hypothetical protein